MSTERRQASRQERRDPRFETRETSISPASCAARDTNSWAFAPKGGARSSSFGIAPTRRDDVMAFYGDATSVRPLAFSATIKDMKGLLHNG